MTSKYFGEFLIEKGIITEENLVDALVEQISTTPPICQVVVEKKILPAKKVFEAFRYQQENNVEFVQACKALGTWTQEIQDRAFSVIDDLRKPLGHILVKKGLIDLKKLTSMLDEFMSQITTSVAAPVIQPVVTTPKAPVTPVTSEMQISYDDLSENIQPGILSELEEVFDEKKKKMVRVALSLIKDNAGTDGAICKKLLGDVAKIVSSLNIQMAMLALDKLSQILSSMESYIATVQPSATDRSAEAIANDVAVLLKAVDCCWSLRGSVIANASEKNFFQDEANLRQFKETLAALKV
jgi:hypothetical protein